MNVVMLKLQKSIKSIRLTDLKVVQLKLLTGTHKIDCKIRDPPTTALSLTASIHMHMLSTV